MTSGLGPYRLIAALLAVYVVAYLLHHYSSSPRSVVTSKRSGEIKTPNYVSCFKQVQEALSDESNLTQGFCMAPCVEELRQYLKFRGASIKLGMAANFTTTTTSGSSLGLMQSPTLLPGNFSGAVLINSPGGTGSSFFNQIVGRLRYKTNNYSNKDGMKHNTVDQLDVNSTGRVVLLQSQCLRFRGRPCQANKTRHPRAAVRRKIYKERIHGKYNGVISVLGNPAHAIFSLYSRHYQRSQYAVLNEPPDIPEDWKENVTKVFEDSALHGQDAFGIARHYHQWSDLQKYVHFGLKDLRTDELRAILLEEDGAYDPLIDEFPPIFMTDIRTVTEAPSVVAALFGVKASDILDVVATTPVKEKTKHGKKLGKEVERAIVESVGATEIYYRLEQQIQQTIKQNYLFYAMELFCEQEAATVAIE